MGVNPYALSNPGFPKEAAAAVDRNTISRIIDMLSASRDVGGFGGSLRYCDLGVFLQQMNCSWDTERVDDCWFDMVRGKPVSLVDSVPWAAQCIYEHLHGRSVDLLPSDFIVRAQEKSGSSPEQACQLSRIATAPPVPRPPQEVQLGKLEKPLEPSRDPPAKNRRPCRPDTARFASPTLSSTRRSHTTSKKLHSRDAGESSPKRTRSPTNVEVFQRLIEDARNRRKRSLITTEASTKIEAAPPPSPPTATETVSNVAVAATRKVRCSSSCLNSRYGSPSSPKWNKPTKSFTAKLTPEPELPDHIGTAAPTPRVERRTPPGPSAVVPSGYVEAVARLRSFAASRNHHHPFLDSLRAQTTVSTLEAQSPILRLPVSAGDNDKAVVDVRLGTPVRDRRRLIPRDIPYDDPSRVHFQGLLREIRSPFHHRCLPVSK